MRAIDGWPSQRLFFKKVRDISKYFWCHTIFLGIFVKRISCCGFACPASSWVTDAYKLASLQYFGTCIFHLGQTYLEKWYLAIKIWQSFNSAWLWMKSKTKWGKRFIFFYWWLKRFSKGYHLKCQTHGAFWRHVSMSLKDLISLKIILQEGVF